MIFRNLKLIDFGLSYLLSLSSYSFIWLIILILIYNYNTGWILIGMVFKLLVFMNQIENLLWNCYNTSTCVIWQSNWSWSVTWSPLLFACCLFTVVIALMSSCSSRKWRLWSCENTLRGKHYFWIVIQLIYLLRCMLLDLLFWYHISISFFILLFKRNVYILLIVLNWAPWT